MSDVIPDLELELAELRDEHVAGSAAKRSEIAASIARMIQGLEHVLREASEEVTAARSELTRGLIALNGSVLIAAVAMFSTNELRTIVAVAGFAAWWGLINAFAYWLFNLGLPLIADGYLTRMKRYQLEWEAFEALVDATPTSVREMKSALNKQKNFIGRIARSTRVFDWITTWVAGATMARTAFLGGAAVMFMISSLSLVAGALVLSPPREPPSAPRSQPVIAEPRPSKASEQPQSALRIEPESSRPFSQVRRSQPIPDSPKPADHLPTQDPPAASK